MQLNDENDFALLGNQFAEWRRRFPMFDHDVRNIEKIIDQHIQEHSKIMVMHRQTHNRSYLEKAQQEIDAMNTILSTVEKMELMSLLSRG